MTNKMDIKLKNIFSLNEIGGRDNNEDSIYPKKRETNTHDKLFLVCDGVGGSDKGEIASQIVCESMSKYFNLRSESEFDEINEAYIKGAVEYTQDNIDEYLIANPNSKGMGTTLTLLSFHSKGGTIAHIGDSRVYQIRNQEIIFKTQDHSFVNELVKDGIITEEKAKTHPKRNVITRVIQGNSVKSTQADVFIQKDIQKDDYFFMCTDGILEQVSDEMLLKILSMDITDEEKISFINKTCEGQTKDNYSCYLISIKNVKRNMEKENDDIIEGVVIEDKQSSFQ